MTVQPGVVVTGAGAGIGRAIAELLHRRGWFVVGIERDESLAQRLAAHLGGAGAVVTGDVTDRGTLTKARQCTDNLRGWVNNAAVTLHEPLHRSSEHAVRRLLSVNLEAVFWGCAEAVSSFLETRTRGSIVNVSSIHARASFPNYAAYDTAKGGVEALTRYIAVEYGPSGIRANCVAPGAIRTQILQSDIDSSPDPAQREREYSSLHPLGRLGEPGEVASMVNFLLSEEAAFVSGQSIGIDGGAAARCYPFPGWSDNPNGAQP